jgi:hypothetical protein
VIGSRINPDHAVKCVEHLHVVFKGFDNSLAGGAAAEGRMM